ncbi:MAG: hypothetical protein ABI789_12430 [Usitatibacter sp.]
MATVTWHTLIDEAGTEHDVVDVVKDFVAGLDRIEIFDLPEECRPGKFFDANDITSYAFVLAKHDCGDARASQTLHNLALFFSEASIRLSKILSDSNVSQDDTRHSA